MAREPETEWFLRAVRSVMPQSRGARRFLHCLPRCRYRRRLSPSDTGCRRGTNCASDLVIQPLMRVSRALQQGRWPLRRSEKALKRCFRWYARRGACARRQGARVRGYAANGLGGCRNARPQGLPWFGDGNPNAGPHAMHASDGESGTMTRWLSIFSAARLWGSTPSSILRSAAV